MAFWDFLTKKDNQGNDFFHHLLGNVTPPQDLGQAAKQAFNLGSKFTPMGQVGFLSDLISNKLNTPNPINKINDIAGGIVGGAAQAAVQAPFRISSELTGKPTSDLASSIQSNPAGKFLLGDQPIESASTYGKNTVSDFGGLIGKPELGKNLPGPAAASIGLVLAAGDLFVGGSEKKVVDELSKADNVSSILKIFSKDKNLATLAPDVQKTTAEALKTVSKPDEVRSVLQKAFQDTNKVPEPIKVPELQAAVADLPGDKGNVAQLSQQAVNSIENEPNIKPGALQKAKDEILAGNMPPVVIRPADNGRIAIEDGTHHLQAAKELGLKDYPITYHGVDAKAAALPEPIIPKGTLDRTKNWPTETKGAFADFTNERRAASIEGAAVAEKFKPLDAEGLNGLFKVQAGENTGLYGELRNYFDTKFRQVRDAGTDIGYQHDYLPQLWADPAKDVAKVFEGKAIGMKPSFTMERVIEDYKAGIEAGLTPRFNKVSDLVNWYESSANKLLANKKFVDKLIEQKRLLPADKAPSDWVTIDPERFPGGAAYKADPSVAKVLNEYLRPPNEILSKVAGVFSRFKNILLGAGVPGTGINIHGVTTLIRKTMLDSNPITGFLGGAKDILYTKGAAKRVSLEEAAYYTRRGLTATTEDHALVGALKDSGGNILKKSGRWLSGKQQEWFEDPLFKGVLPDWKIRYIKKTVPDLEKSGMTKIQAEKVAIKTANEAFGGINSEAIGRNKDLQNLFRVFALAPDFLETNLKIPARIAQSWTTQIKGPELKAYRAFTRNMVLTYLAANIINKQTSGHYMTQNQPGNKFNIEVGQEDANGKQKSVPVFGSAVDFLRVPVQVAEQLAQGNTNEATKVIRSRLSIPFSAAIAFLSNTDSLGNTILGKDKYGQPQTPAEQAGNVGNVLSQAVLPQQVQAPVQLAQGKIDPLQATTQALEIPLRYKTVSKKTKGSSISRGKGIKTRKVRISKGRKGRVKISRARISTRRVKSARIKVAKIRVSKVKVQ